MGNKDEIKLLRKKVQTLKAELDEALRERRRADVRIQNLETENFALRRSIDKNNQTRRFYTGEIERLKKELAGSAAPAGPAAKKIGEWNVVKSGGYYRAFRRIDGRLHGVYLGKSLRGAAQKIKAKEAEI